MTNIALSDADLSRALGNDTIILSYDQLAKFRSIEDILRQHSSAIILYLNNGDNYGHWTALIKHPDRVEFFDPYGGRELGKPDAEFKFIDKQQRKKNYRGVPYLSKLLHDYASRGGVVEYNNHALQRESSTIATCGRHCIARIKTRRIPLDTYAGMLKGLGNIDEAIVKLTKPLVGK